MSSQRRLAVTASPRVAVDQTRFALLEDCGVHDSCADPALDRWMRALVRNTGAAAAALCLSDLSRGFVPPVTDPTTG